MEDLLKLLSAIIPTNLAHPPAVGLFEIEIKFVTIVICPHDGRLTDFQLVCLGSLWKRIQGHLAQSVT